MKRFSQMSEDEFTDYVAFKCVKSLTPEEKEVIVSGADVMYCTRYEEKIKKKYILNNAHQFDNMYADDLAAEVMDKIVEILTVW